MTELRMVVTTFAQVPDAQAFVRTLVEERLIACGSILPGVCSIYRWEDKVQDEPECMVWMKTRADAVPRLLERADQLHPYAVPEVLVLPIEAGPAPYLDWVSSEVSL